MEIYRLSCPGFILQNLQALEEMEAEAAAGILGHLEPWWRKLVGGDWNIFPDLGKC